MPKTLFDNQSAKSSSAKKSVYIKDFSDYMKNITEIIDTYDQTPDAIQVPKAGKFPLDDYLFIRGKEAEVYQMQSPQNYNKFIDRIAEESILIHNLVSFDDYYPERKMFTLALSLQQKQALSQFEHEARKTYIACRSLAATLLTTRSIDSHKEIVLLNQALVNVNHFLEDPHDPKVRAELIETGLQLEQKFSKTWTGVKKAFQALVGAAMIVTGVLGLVPSFGASIALIVVGSAVCAKAGLGMFDNKIKGYEQATKSIKNLLTDGKKLMKMNLLTKDSKLDKSKDDFDLTSGESIPKYTTRRKSM